MREILENQLVLALLVDIALRARCGGILCVYEPKSLSWTSRALQSDVNGAACMGHVNERAIRLNSIHSWSHMPSNRSAVDPDHNLFDSLITS